MELTNYIMAMVPDPENPIHKDGMLNGLNLVCSQIWLCKFGKVDMVCLDERGDLAADDISICRIKYPAL